MASEVSSVHLHGSGHGTRKHAATSDAVSSGGSTGSGSISRRRKLHLHQRDMWSKVESNFVSDDVKQIMILPDSASDNPNGDDGVTENENCTDIPIIEFDHRLPIERKAEA